MVPTSSPGGGLHPPARHLVVEVLVFVGLAQGLWRHAEHGPAQGLGGGRSVDLGDSDSTRRPFARRPNLADAHRAGLGHLDGVCLPRLLVAQHARRHEQQLASGLPER
jgi:hypothetical protein